MLRLRNIRLDTDTSVLNAQAALPRDITARFKRKLRNMKIHLNDLDRDFIYTENKEEHSRHFPGQAYNKAKRWVQSQIGNKYDDVFSKWVKLTWIPAKWRNKYWLGMFVEFNIVGSNGGLVSTYGKWSPIDYKDYIYVDKDGYLRLHKKPKRLPKPQDTDHIILTDYTQYAKIGGLWYHVTLPNRMKVCWSFSERGSWFTPDVPKRMKYKDFIYKFQFERHHVIKRSLSRKELRRAGLKNDQLFTCKVAGSVVDTIHDYHRTTERKTRSRPQ